jgi:hypothetical protein
MLQVLQCATATADPFYRALQCAAVGGRFQRLSAVFAHFSSFSFPPHIPTGIKLGWGVRRAGRAQLGGFRHPDLYGKFQKSTAATQIQPGPRTTNWNLHTLGRSGELPYSGLPTSPP